MHDQKIVDVPSNWARLQAQSASVNCVSIDGTCGRKCICDWRCVAAILGKTTLRLNEPLDANVFD